MSNRFPLGQVVVTPAARSAFRKAGQQAFVLIARHCCGENKAGLNGSLVSIFNVGGKEMCVLTEEDRSVTTVFLSSQ